MQLTAEREETNQGASSPEKGDILKTYMRNQLELQESEWESYEETINSLAEQLETKSQELEKKTEEYNRLVYEHDTLNEQSSATIENLMSRIAGIEQQALHDGEKLQYLASQLVAANTQNVNGVQELAEALSAQEQYELKATELESELQQRESLIHQLADDLKVAMDASVSREHDFQSRAIALTEENERLKLLADDSARIKEMLDQASEELQVKSRRINELQHQINASGDASAAIYSIADELRRDISNVQLESDKNSKNAQLLAMELAASEARNESSKKDLQDALAAKTEFELKLANLQSDYLMKERSVSHRVSELERVIKASADREQELQNRMLTSSSKKKASRLSVQEKHASLSHERNSPNRTNLTVNFDTPGGDSIISGESMTSSRNFIADKSSMLQSPAVGDEEILKNYMSNQLELQTAEWESYEEQINLLTSQLDNQQLTIESQEEKIRALTLEKEDLLSEKEQYLSQLSNANSLSVTEPVSTSALRGNRPSLLTVDFPSSEWRQDLKPTNQPSSNRSTVSISSSSHPPSPMHVTLGFNFDFSSEGLDTIHEQIEHFRTLTEQQVSALLIIMSDLCLIRYI